MQTEGQSPRTMRVLWSAATCRRFRLGARAARVPARFFNCLGYECRQKASPRGPCASYGVRRLVAALDLERERPGCPRDSSIVLDTNADRRPVPADHARPMECGDLSPL